MPKGKDFDKYEEGGASWTDFQVEELLDLAFSGKMTLESVARHFDRSYHAIRGKIWKVMGKYHGHTHVLSQSTARSGARWCQLEREMLELALEKHQDYVWLALCLKRTVDEVRPKPTKVRCGGFGFSG